MTPNPESGAAERTPESETVAAKARETVTPAIVVAICTFKRPSGLASLLGRLRELPGRERALIVVVDNDPDGSAASVVTSENAAGDRTVEYTVAVPQGLSTARNAALNIAGARHLPVAFIDDDEVPSDGWLASLLATHERFPGAIVAGAVRPEIRGALPAWSPDGGFWKRREYDDNEPLTQPVGDGNILYPVEVTASSLRYDPAFDLTGGQDTHLLLRWLSSGGRIVWSAGAAVTEIVPSERLSLEYATSRAFFSASAYQLAVNLLGTEGRTRTAARILRRLALGLMYGAAGALTASKQLKATSRLHRAAARGTWAGVRSRQVNRWVGYQADV